MDRQVSLGCRDEGHYHLFHNQSHKLRRRQAHSDQSVRKRGGEKKATRQRIYIAERDWRRIQAATSRTWTRGRLRFIKTNHFQVGYMRTTSNLGVTRRKCYRVPRIYRASNRRWFACQLSIYLRECMQQIRFDSIQKPGKLEKYQARCVDRHVPDM